MLENIIKSWSDFMCINQKHLMNFLGSKAKVTFFLKQLDYLKESDLSL